MTKQKTVVFLGEDRLDALVNIALEMVNYEAEKWERDEGINGAELVAQFAHWRSRLMQLVGE